MDGCSASEEAELVLRGYVDGWMATFDGYNTAFSYFRYFSGIAIEIVNHVPWYHTEAGSGIIGRGFSVQELHDIHLYKPRTPNVYANNALRSNATSKCNRSPRCCRKENLNATGYPEHASTNKDQQHFLLVLIIGASPFPGPCSVYASTGTPNQERLSLPTLKLPPGFIPSK